MKKNICLLLILCALAAMLGCGQPAASQEATGPVSTTLMVYMIGSDLEAKAGAATSDLEEMAASGIDLTSHKVVICAGGSPYWHNEVATTEQRTVLTLTDTGFQQLTAFDTMSMGEAQCLTEFLNYTVENCPSERYALILWNHGNGPLMGYGKDMLYENDSLLLEEMKQAMEASAFGPENKLCWVGFDACLMASAELSCLWSDYADYLVASQEVEPSFGWSYSFLSDLGNRDVPALLTRLTQDYLAACEAYFAERGYENRDATLACVDLSVADQLQAALNGLFDRAMLGAEDDYNELVALRVQTRALGRNSTGSEYDLVDLKDMALQLQTLYPEETGLVLEAVEKMVISNATNAVSCCGMSLYFPFYNKYYYEKNWQQTYNSLDSFESYTDYLAEYEKKWLNPDLVSAFSSSFSPSVKDGEYTLTLSQEQEANYASARYYILQRESEQMYTFLFASSDVTREGNVLTANFDGKVIYVKDYYQNYFIPVTVELEKIGDLSYYVVPFAVMNGDIGSAESTEYLRYHLALNDETGEITVGALLPTSQSVNSNTLMGGKLEDEDLSKWQRALFMSQDHIYLTRDENGAILPLDQWHQNSWVTAMEIFGPSELEFSCEFLDGGEYYLMMEVRDTYGNRYCSELLPVDVPEEEKPSYDMPQTQVTWGDEDHILLIEEKNVEVYLTSVEVTGKIKYTLEVRNHNDFAVELEAMKLMCNDNIICWKSDASGEGRMGSIVAQPGQTNWFYDWVDMGMVEATGDLKELKSFTFNVEIREVRSGRIVLPLHQFHVELTPEKAQYLSSMQDLRVATPQKYMGARAGEQVIYEDDRARVSLVCFGDNSKDPGSYSSAVLPDYVLRIENKTEEYQVIGLGGFAVNNVFIRTNNKAHLPGGCIGYVSGTLYSGDLEDADISQIESLSVLVQFVQDSTFFSGFSEPHWCEVKLTEAAPRQQALRESSQVIFEKNGVRVALDPMEVSSLGDPSWRVTVYNGSEDNITVTIRDITIDGVPVDPDDYSVMVYMLYAQAGPGQYGVGILSSDKDAGTNHTLRFKIQLMDVNEEYVIYTDTETVTLQVQLPS